MLRKASLIKALLALACSQASLLTVSGEATGTRCPTVANAASCVCAHSTGVIDLTQFSNTDGTPRFKGYKDLNNYEYSYNPCTTFSSIDSCANVYACQYETTGSGLNYEIASSGTEAIYTDTDGSIYLHYEGVSGRETRVYLDCDPTMTGDPVFTAEGDFPVFLQYVFHLKHAGVCPGSAPGPGPSPGSVAPWVYAISILGALAGIGFTFGGCICCIVIVVVIVKLSQQQSRHYNRI